MEKALRLESECHLKRRAREELALWGRFSSKMATDRLMRGEDGPISVVPLFPRRAVGALNDALGRRLAKGRRERDNGLTRYLP
jgi:hypothetical protein